MILNCKKMLILLVILCFIPALSAFAEEANLLQNASFEDSFDKDIYFWTTWAYNTGAGVSDFKADETVAHTGKKSVLIVNTMKNDARFQQSIVKIKPNSYYKLSCWVKTENVPDSPGAGANISIKNLGIRSKEITGTTPGWEYVELYGRTGPNQDNLVLTLGLGGYGGDNTGKAWFDDVSMTEQLELPKDISTVNLYQNSAEADTKNTNPMSTLYVVLVIFAILFMCILSLIIGYLAIKKRNAMDSNIQRNSKEPSKIVEAAKDIVLKFRMTKKDYYIMGIMTVIYLIISLVNLGSTKVPKTEWKPFAPGESIVVDMGKTIDLSRIYYYCASGEGKFRVEFYDESTKKYVPLVTLEKKDFYLWKYVTTSAKASKFKIIADSTEGIINEIGFFEGFNQTPVKGLKIIENKTTPHGQFDVNHLFDEQNIIDYKPSYMTGTYFDEIYHARTAFEHLNHLEPYETTHPPLGKIFIMIGIWIFGMNPFGWRIAGALFGVFMIPMMYLLGKKFFGKTFYAFCTAFLMMFDFMHFTQTRIATIDVFGTFFIIVMYYFMYDFFMNKTYRGGLFKSLKPLFLSGLFFGIGAASKWIGLYAGGGLAVLFFIAVGTSIYDYVKEEQKPEPAAWTKSFWWPNTIVTTLSCLIFFVLIPGVIYYLSYIPTMLVPGHTSSITEVWNIQVNMFKYHYDLKATHPFQSPAWTWPFVWKPMWFYDGKDMVAGMKSSIVTMGNPAIWWTGTIAFFVAIGIAISKRDKRMIFIFVGAMFQYVPWLFINRAIFIYHFFSTVPFLIIAIVYCIRPTFEYGQNMLPMIDIALKKQPAGKQRSKLRTENAFVKECYKFKDRSVQIFPYTPYYLAYYGVFIYLGLVLLLFIMFYPVLSGMIVPEWYKETFLKWDKWIPFFRGGSSWSF